ncbi:MAG: hypothetical protein DRQ55_02185 [Planctomycetota bacterium]|nr:MAG: hypothetical protein DRQ55_02185 [Planctomycetota bacterium]
MTKSMMMAGVLLATVIGAAGSVGAGEVPEVGEAGGPLPGLSTNELRHWLNGRVVFDRNFNSANGLGTPELNADSCRACHQDPVLGGAGGLELNVSRFGRDHDGYGPFENLDGGQALSKLRPPGVEGRENYDPDMADVFEQRQTPSALGAGLIDAIPDAVIMANADPDDLDGNGIRGVARLLTVAGEIEVGRFGWKAQVPHIGDFARDAMGGECGITTPSAGRGFALEVDSDTVADPELSQADLDDVIFFMAQLAPPARVGAMDPAVGRGEQLFHFMRCDMCHTPELEGPTGPVKLYSNLLLHDVMGSEYRGMAEEGAPSGYFRTPPLWGIRDTAPYMHDGRAETLVDAIAAHAGEAAGIAAGFASAPVDEQDALLAFLRDL